MYLSGVFTTFPQHDERAVAYVGNTPDSYTNYLTGKGWSGTLGAQADAINLSQRVLVRALNGAHILVLKIDGTQGESDKAISFTSCTITEQSITASLGLPVITKTWAWVAKNKIEVDT